MYLSWSLGRATQIALQVRGLFGRSLLGDTSVPLMIALGAVTLTLLIACGTLPIGCLHGCVTGSGNCDAFRSGRGQKRKSRVVHSYW
jgi:hypothetical protein